MFILPNLFTVSSIFCGFYAAVSAASAAGDSAPTWLYRASIAVLFAMIFDSVDGRVARLTRTQSEFGLQMDSLADVISFGVAPALVAWHWGLSSFGTAGLVVCFVYCACGAIRLARFNVLAAQGSGPSSYFVGLPIPAAAGLLVATVIASLRAGRGVLEGTEVWAPIMMVALGFLMVSTVRFRTFKATRMTRRAFGLIMAVFGLTVLVAVRVRPSFAIVLLMGSYLAFGLAEEVVRRARRRPASDGAPVSAMSDLDDDDDDDAGLDDLDADLDADPSADYPPDLISADDDEELLD